MEQEENKDKEASVNNETLIEVLKGMFDANKELVSHMQKDAKRRFYLLAILFAPTLLIVLFTFGSQAVKEMNFNKKGYVAVVPIHGPIMEGSLSSADRLYKPLKQAFEDEEARGVIIRISSPGGSPTQAHLIQSMITDFKAQFPEKQVVVVAEEMVASAAYWIASAVETIYVQPTTITGSIGVVYESYDLSQIPDKYGVDRRIYTAGEAKRRLNPFKKAEKEDVEKMQNMLDGIHQLFIAQIKSSRKDRLASDVNLFDGDTWLGYQAVELGLADGTKTLRQVIREDFKAENIKPYAPKKTFEEMMGGKGGLISVIADQFAWVISNGELSEGSFH